MNDLGKAFSVIKPRYDDSGMDRMNYYYTPVIISFLAVTLTAKQYVGEPLQCWVPSQFTKAWEQYAENYCFVYNTYWVPQEEEVPREIERRIAAQLTYYQWVPFIMLMEAGLFHLPALIWTALATSSGLNLSGLVKTAVKADDENNEEKIQATVYNVCTILEDSNRIRKARNEGAGKLEHYRRLGKLDGTYLSNVYLFSKLLYCGNIFLQFYSMNYFLAQPDHFWGATILADIVGGTNWEDSGNFPRIAMCDFQVRVLGNLQRFSIQCVLVLNMFNEKIFLFLYWWIILIGLLTAVDAIMQIINMKYPSRRQSFVGKFLRCKPEERAVFDDFTNGFLNPDLFLIIRMISGHTSEIFTRNLLQTLFENYRSSEEAMLNHPYLKHLENMDSTMVTPDIHLEGPTPSDLHRPNSLFKLYSPGSPPMRTGMESRTEDERPGTIPSYTQIKFQPISLLSPSLSQE